MLRRKILAAVTTLALALGMSVGGAGAAFATVPSPPDLTPAVAPDECVPQAAIPPTDAVTTTQLKRYAWNGGRTDTAPEELPPRGQWTGNNKRGHDIPGKSKFLAGGIVLQKECAKLNAAPFVTQA